MIFKSSGKQNQNLQRRTKFQHNEKLGDLLQFSGAAGAGVADFRSG